MTRVNPEFIDWLNQRLEADGLRVEAIDAENGTVAVTLPGGQARRHTVDGNLDLGMLVAALLEMVRTRAAMKPAYTAGRMRVPEPQLRIAVA